MPGAWAGLEPDRYAWTAVLHRRGEASGRSRVEADPRQLLRDYLVQRVEHGIVRSRADIVATLKEAGLEVPRQGKSYVTAHDPETEKRWRLKGALYEDDFNPERLDGPDAAQVGDRPSGDRGDRNTGAAAAWRELEEALRGARNVPSKPIWRRGPDGRERC